MYSHCIHTSKHSINLKNTSIRAHGNMRVRARAHTHTQRERTVWVGYIKYEQFARLPSADPSCRSTFGLFGGVIHTSRINSFFNNFTVVHMLRHDSMGRVTQITSHLII